MKYNAFGRTGLKVSEIGFGTWGLGGDSYGPVDDQVSILALKRARKLGINFYDTADLYGAGRAERILGQTFAGKREEIIITSKVGNLPHKEFFMPQDFSEAHIRNGLEASLSRLQTDYIDIYLLHSPDLNTLNWEECLATLRSLKQAGKIRAFGVSARSPRDAKVAILEHDIEIVEVNFNLIDQRAIEEGLIKLCEERAVALIARTPLCFGYLSGRLTGDEAFVGEDHRAKWPKAQLKRWASAPQLFRGLGDAHGWSLSTLAIKFCISFPGVATVIPGMMNIAEVEENARVSELKALGPSDIERAYGIYKEHDFFDNTIKQKAIQAEKGLS